MPRRAERNRPGNSCLAVAALALCAAASGCGRKDAGVAAVEPPAAVPSSATSPSGAWVEVHRETIQDLYPAVGMFRARQTTRVGPQVSGRVSDVLVDVGDVVRRDQPLVRIDPTFFEIDVSLKEADLQAARVALEEADLNLQRMKNLWEKPEGKEPSIPKKAYDDARFRSEAAAARRKQAEESLRTAKEHLSECTAVAPYDGVISRRLVDVGEPVNSTPVTHLVEIEETGVLELEFSLPQQLLSSVGPGTRVEFEAEGVAGGTGSGEISTVFPTVDESTRTVRCRVLVENSPPRFRSGLLVEVRVALRKVEDALTVPRQALRQAAGAWRVVVLDGGRAASREVRVGVQDGSRVQVVEGLVDGDRVRVPDSVNAEARTEARAEDRAENLR